MSDGAWALADMQGVDADVRTSLVEYGLAWIEEADSFHVFHWHSAIANNRYDHSSVSKDTDPRKEWNWVKDWSEVDLSESIPVIVQELISRHGVENVLGSSYWEGFVLDENEEYLVPYVHC